MNRVCRNLVRSLKANGLDNGVKAIIAYGSNIYEQPESDLDLLFITKNKLDDEELRKYISFIREFHNSEELPIDVEVPYETKLVISEKELNYLLSYSPFKVNDHYEIKNIRNSEQYLKSTEMKQRLLINSLTSDHMLVLGNEKYIIEFEDRAWNIVFDLLINAFGLDLHDTSKVVETLIKNPCNNLVGEEYLGYKNQEKKLLALYKNVEQKAVIYNGRI